MNKFKKFAFGAGLAAMTLLPSVLTVHAINLNDNLDAVGTSSGQQKQDLTQTVGSLIQTFLGILGIVFLVLTIYAGFTWMTAAGDSKKVDSAKNILISAVVGLVVLLSAYAISSFVIDNLSKATGNV
ncbi:MAG: hypothetical protein WC813_04410 [Patescibacteria group bacterium]|jgi:hypothetical protein